VTSQTAHPKYKWPPMTLNQNTPHENFLRTPLHGTSVTSPHRCSMHQPITWFRSGPIFQIRKLSFVRCKRVVIHYRWK